MPCPAWPRELDVPYGTRSLATAPYSCPNGTLAVPAGDDDAGQLGAGTHAQLAEDPAQMRLDRPHGDVELFGDLAIAFARCGQRGHPQLGLGESGKRLRRAHPATGRVAVSTGRKRHGTTLVRDHRGSTLNLARLGQPTRGPKALGVTQQCPRQLDRRDVARPGTAR